MLLGFCGYGSSGKDTAARGLISNGWKRRAFADPIRDLAYKLNPIIPIYDGHSRLADIVDRLGWDESKKMPEIREILQRLGVGARDVLGDDIWVNSAFSGMDYLVDNYIITDVRMPDEVIKIHRLGGYVVRITRPGISAKNNHITETALDNVIVDKVISNDGTTEELENKVKDAVRICWKL